jgi:hypothetical protein
MTTTIGDMTMQPSQGTASTVQVLNDDTEFGFPIDRIYSYSFVELLNGKAVHYAATTVDLYDCTETTLSSTAFPPLSAFNITNFTIPRIIFEASNVSPAIADSVAVGEILTLDAYTTPEPATAVPAGIVALMGLGYAWRRRKANPAA